MRRGGTTGRWLAALVVAGGVLWTARAAHADADGWQWLIDKLVADGVSRARATAAFEDPRVPPFDGLDFGLHPQESHAMYRGFLRADSLARAHRCRETWSDALRSAEAQTGVSADVVAAIIHVESGCGRNTGSHPILPGLARLAMANEPANLARNLARHTAGLGGEAREEVAARVRQRAETLEATFYPEVLATFTVAERLGVPPLSLRGSGSGAFGIPQFLPGSYLRHGADADGDGTVSLYDHADAILSCARYLQAHGWRPGMSHAERRRVIWAYNHSDAYIDTVLALADRIDQPVVMMAHGGRRTTVAARSRHTTRTAAAHRGKHGTTASATARGRKTTRSASAKARSKGTTHTARAKGTTHTPSRAAKPRSGATSSLRAAR